jgi:hypothetical protein
MASLRFLLFCFLLCFHRRGWARWVNHFILADRVASCEIFFHPKTPLNLTFSNFSSASSVANILKGNIGEF